MDEKSAVTPRPTSNANAPFEQQLYLHSPFGSFATTALVFAALFGSYLVAAILEHETVVQQTAYGPALGQAAWSAFVLSLLCCAALGMQRYAHQSEVADVTAYARILTGGMASASRVTTPDVRQSSLIRATILGIAVGLVITTIVRQTEIGEGHLISAGSMAWFAFASTFLSVLFARGVEQTRVANQRYGNLLKAELKIDLLRIDMLAVLGRAAARSALIWFVTSAVTCLFFVGGDLTWLTITLIIACAAMGIGMFVSVMNRIHRQIVAAKNEELERVRIRIDKARVAVEEDEHAAMRLHGLLAYEKRILEAHEWPFDQSTLFRLGASASIVVVPWIGRAMVGYVIYHFSRIAG
jgi:hypothetical protein